MATQSQLPADNDAPPHGADSLVAATRRILEMIAAGASLTDILTNVCTAIDAQYPDMMSMVLLMDPDGRRMWVVAAPRVPADFVKAMSPVMLDPAASSCGTTTFHKERVISADIASDPLWVGRPWCGPALANNLRAAWSQPLLSRNNEPLGTFVFFHSTPRSPTPEELCFIGDAAQVAIIAIEGERARTALQKAVAELNEAQDCLRTMLDTIPTQAWSLNADGSIAYLNQRWHEYTGLSREEVFGSWKGVPGRVATAAELSQVMNHPDDVHTEERRQEILSPGKPGEFEQRQRRHDGEYRWFLIRMEPVHDEHGNIVRWYGTSTDIEDLKRAEAKLRQDEKELRGIVDAISQAIVVLSPEGRGLYANRSTLDYTGLTMEQLMTPDSNGNPTLFHPEDWARLQEERRQRLAKEEPFELEWRMRRKDGQFRWFLVRYYPLKDEQGQILRWYASGTDIDDRKRAEERMQNENLALREEIDRASMFEEIVGSSGALRRALAQVARVAAMDTTVLILGETGTGKELFARAIHRRSSRSARAFIRVNCAAIPQALIASELFGHEKGAFTGALSRRLGRFEAADGGTILLDEVAELPPETQVALLRVLQEREIERVGSSHPIPVDVRVLASTNRGLEPAVESGAFRQDLYYRLNVFPIHVPPLRERVGDIPLLVEYLVERYARSAGKSIRHISKRTLDRLQAYEWPGNVRELQNVIERAVVLCDGDTFAVDESWLKAPPSQQSRQPSQPLTTLAQGEKALIEAALAESKGRISGPNGAAARLGIPRQTLESKIKALRIDRLSHQKR